MIYHDEKDKIRIEALYRLHVQLFEHLRLPYHKQVLRKNVSLEYDLAFHFNADGPEDFDTYYITVRRYGRLR